ncbi:putative porin [Litorilituus sediminis]|nr:putative porin [Litorilituus sediminis]
MRLSLVAAAMAASSVFAFSAAHAEDSFQSFSSINYQTQDQRNGNLDWFSLNSRYYFDARTALGPLNEFDYINSISNLGVSYSYMKSEYDKVLVVDQDGTIVDFEASSKNQIIHVDGEWFIGNFLLGGGASYIDSSSSSNFMALSPSGVVTQSGHNSDDQDTYYRADLGYLITQNLIIKASYHDINNFLSYTVSYNFDFNDSDYIGFSYNTDEDFDTHSLSTKYFANISTTSYLVLGAAYWYYGSSSVLDNDYWSIYSSYYFNKFSSVSASYGENDNYSVSVNHYFTDNFALGAFYSDQKDSNDENWGVNFTAQF